MSKRIKKLYIKRIIKIFLVITILLIYDNLCYDKKHTNTKISEFKNTYISEGYKSFNELQKLYKEQKTIIINLNNEINEKNKQLELVTQEYDELKDKHNRLTNSTSRSYVRQINSNMWFSPHEKTNYTVEELNIMLKGTGLENCGNSFKNMEDTYSVNSLFAMSVAMHESGNGYKTINTNNYFGFRGNSGWMYFNSKDDCIMYFGNLIHEYYSKYTTIEAIQTKYCPDGSPWANRIKTHMYELQSKLKGDE